MSLLTKRNLAVIKEVLGHHRNLHPHLAALQEGKDNSRDIDIILEELEFYVTKKRNFLDPFLLSELEEAINKLRNS